MSGQGFSGLALLGGVLWLGYVTAPVGIVLIVLGLAWLWKRS